MLHVGKVDAASYPLAKKKTSYEFLREKVGSCNTPGACHHADLELHSGALMQILLAKTRPAAISSRSSGAMLCHDSDLCDQR